MEMSQQSLFSRNSVEKKKTAKKKKKLILGNANSQIEFVFLVLLKSFSSFINQEKYKNSTLKLKTYFKEYFLQKQRNVYYQAFG